MMFDCKNAGIAAGRRSNRWSKNLPSEKEAICNKWDDDNLNVANSEHLCTVISSNQSMH